MTHVSPSLVRFQVPALKGLGRVALQTVLPIGRMRSGGSAMDLPAIDRVVSAPAPSLVDSYVAWCGATGRYDKTLPPHMMSQWGIPLVTELLLQTAYPLATVINQGVTMSVHGDLPRGEQLHLRAAMHSVDEDQGRTRVSVSLTTGTAQAPDLVEVILHMVFIKSGSPKRKGGQESREEPIWHTAGQWQAGSRDGLEFAILTGDFNPIHWIGLAGKFSAFKQKVLHGFGMFVRSYEQLDAPNLRVIDVRFLRPVPLPSRRLTVQVAAPDSDGWRALQLAGEAGTVHLAGRWRD
ncbi:MaoC/PaaZ C-terminal domain-containing protein [Nocardioides sp.]|uniref:MaoC/PaaZ C-terminal domain-containing protein n=1 Tax=Nocardioides sp. TaxID=35761 RepID=UPI002B5DE853|nr:MaoC/PaaZ C-terminal domain-containing protein [Nocardioides sp.]HSX65917.1 MaoC/PaaZ C-terminal domain-containing protein [Nocardioides sp.]